MQLSERCYAVTGLSYAHPRLVNAGFVAGDEMTLVVDTGPNAQAAATIAGYARAVRPSNELMALNTEPHFDHIGGNSYFRALGRNGQDLRIYGHSGIHRTLAEFAAEAASFGADAAAVFDATELANPNYAVQDDMMLDLGHCPVEVLLTPGHTPSNISVWVPSEGVLYTGDALINGFPPNLSAGDPKQWLDTLRRIERLRPRTLVPGHGPVARGEKVAPLIATLRAVLQLAVS